MTTRKSKSGKVKKPSIIGLPKNPLFQAQRLEGKGPSFAIKNVSPKLKRGKRGDR